MNAGRKETFKIMQQIALPQNKIASLSTKTAPRETASRQGCPSRLNNFDLEQDCDFLSDPGVPLAPHYNQRVISTDRVFANDRVRKHNPKSSIQRREETNASVAQEEIIQTAAISQRTVPGRLKKRLSGEKSEGLETRHNTSQRRKQ